MWLAAAVVAFAVLRMAHGFYLSPLWRARGTTRQGIAQKARKSWSPHVATCVIGMTFVVILLASGNWAYTDVLAELAHGRAANIVARCGLFVALVAGAVFGGATAGRFRSVPITPSQLARCLAGGLLMGWGGLLIPGSNDGLILTGLPLLRPYAWAAFVTMCVVIGCALTIERRLSTARVPRASAPASPAE
jgi:toxin CptA